MSEATARLERRAIRRAIGPKLVSFTTDTAQAIQILQAGIQAEHVYTDARHSDAQTYIGNVSRALHQFKTMSLWQRLRWLVTGHLSERGHARPEHPGKPLPNREFLA